jgi:hypothetical protein
MSELHLLVGQGFAFPCGTEGEPPCNEDDTQDILKKLTDKLGIKPRYETKDGDSYYTLTDMLLAILEHL